MNSEESYESEILYLCGKCGHGILKNDKICPHCGARLGKIKCANCGFVGTDDDYKNDICPKCGKKNTIEFSQEVPTSKRTQKSIYKPTAQSSMPIRFYAVILAIMSIITVGSIFFFLKYFKII